MKVIIAGSRGITDWDTVCYAIRDSKFAITEVVSGMAKGVDTLAIEWGHSLFIDVKCFPADWRKYGNSAGIHRNIEMGNYADALIAIWDGESKGTKHMISYMNKLNKKVFIYNAAK